MKNCTKTDCYICIILWIDFSIYWNYYIDIKSETQKKTKNKWGIEK